MRAPGQGIPPKLWVQEGDRCELIWDENHNPGTVLKITKILSIPHCRVKWDTGQETNHTIVALRKI